jgi:predicted dehydrogenase
VGGDQSRGPANGDFVRRFSAAILGLGQIGQGYDYDASDDGLILTHASAYRHHAGFDLVAGVDPDSEQRERFVRKFGLPAYPNLESLISGHRPEVFSLCVPTAQHFQVFQEIIPCGPAAVLCEKPIAFGLSEAQEMVRLAEAHQVALLVNYIRRFEPGGAALRDVIQRRELGDIYKGVAWYSKGIIHSGSHYIDFLRFLLGEVTGLQVLEKGREWQGHDPEPDVCLSFGTIPVYFLAAREECFSASSIELMGTGGHIHYRDAGARIEVRSMQPDPTYPGYTILNPEPQRIPNDMKRYQWYVLDHLYSHLTGKTALNGDGKSATETLAVIQKIIDTRSMEQQS